MQIEIIAYRFAEAHTAPDRSHTPARWVEVHQSIIENFHALTPPQAFDFVLDQEADRLVIKQGGKTERWEWLQSPGRWKEGWSE
jgi:hypothetical protein